ncbi:MAG: ribose 1,5-bisphosphate isomerase [Candidatus Altiarchaeota archaeon]|nr:ribose 1,5-bisphosphate isomerase [Candidatus Altiarchaeota archaeon]
MDPVRTAQDIKSMKTRGALKIAIAAAKSLRDYSDGYSGGQDKFLKDLERNGRILKNSRPTAVSLPNAVNYVIYMAKNTPDRKELVGKIDDFMDEQRGALERIAEIGSKRIEEGDTILTHCNSMTALETIRAAWDSGKKITVVATETRPRHQGYLTSKYMAKHRIPVTLIIDSAVRFAMRKLDVDKVLIGADTVCANGAVINKIGTSQVALVAKESNVPVMCACETIKFSPETMLGELVEIEDRDHREIRGPIRGVKMLNPAFDFTPPEYVDVIVTEDGIISPYMAYEVLRDKFSWDLKKHG